VKKYITIIFLITTIFSQNEFSGNIHPNGLFLLSNHSQLNLPFKFAEFNLNLPFSDFGEWEFKSNTAIEYRWKTNEHQFDLREAYLMWYPSFGEVKLGKQIHSWGAVDGNNPTDNINAYDYYYMFLSGTDRKVGSVSASTKIYFDNWQVEGVIIPEHVPNRIPFGEEDFPFDAQKPAIIEDAENPLEYGIRLQTSLFESDFSISYFNGFDRGFSQKYLNTLQQNPLERIEFGYRNTEQFGLDFVTFISEFTFRGEFAYFISQHDNSDILIATLLPLEENAEYLQYVLQVEWTALWDIMINTQFIGSKTFFVNGDTFNPIQGVVSLTKDNFKPGMGTPFAMFSDQSLLFSATGNLLDNRLEIRASSMFNLAEKGMMCGLQTDYSPINNWNIELGISQFIGDENDEQNTFTKLEDFSQYSVGLKYSF
jgi:hypothetical protein